ncbi:cancer/testis antigen 55-like isoform X1 [Dipodomys merriami]|uniref:cancer/testis antigen 55-like isoform X1 n=1 Tax=Dipodomys merriami TaxID=94247 RepID=UPI003855FD28
MHRFFSKALRFFGKRTVSEEEKEQHQCLLEAPTLNTAELGTKHKHINLWGYLLSNKKSQLGNTKLKTVEGVVTKTNNDHGWIDESIFFHNENVTGDLPLRIGQKVTAVVEENETSLGWKAIKVEAFCEGCIGGRPSETKMNLTFGVCGDEYLKHSNYFALDVVCKDFDPYEGDLMEVVFSFKTEMQDRKIISVKPLRYNHVKEVFITSIYGKEGVVDSNIFYTLESLKVPAGYQPQVHDLVNVLVVQTAQPGFYWRAISMTPVYMG